MNGISGESTISQLENTIIPELNALIEQIHQNNLPSKEKRFVLSFSGRRQRDRRQTKKNPGGASFIYDSGTVAERDYGK